MSAYIKNEWKECGGRAQRRQLNDASLFSVFEHSGWVWTKICVKNWSHAAVVYCTLCWGYLDTFPSLLLTGQCWKINFTLYISYTLWSIIHEENSAYIGVQSYFLWNNHFVGKVETSLNNSNKGRSNNGLLYFTIKFHLTWNWPLGRVAIVPKIIIMLFYFMETMGNSSASIYVL